MRSGKWRGYLPHCHRFYFAVAKGVCKKSDIPPEAGLIVRGDKGWSTLVGAPVRDIDIPVDTLMSMLFYRAKYHPNFIYREDMYYHIISKKKYMKKLGNKVGKLIYKNQYDKEVYNVPSD